MASENAILDEPIATCTFYTDYKTPRRPILAVASGSFIFLYKNLQPYYKFVLPSNDIIAAEKEAWSSIKGIQSEVQYLTDILSGLQQSNVLLAPRSLEFLNLPEESAKLDFLNAKKKLPLTHPVRLFQQVTLFFVDCCNMLVRIKKGQGRRRSCWLLDCWYRK